jgi:hypothetical protein
MPVVLEAHVRALQLPVPLHVYLVEGVDQDIGDARVVDQRLQRPQPKDLVQDLLDELFPLLEVEGRGLAVQQAPDDLPNLGDRLFFVARAERAEVQPLEQLSVHSRAYLLKLGAAAADIEVRVHL